MGSGWYEDQHLQIQGHVLDQRKVACSLQFGGEILPQAEEFKDLEVLLMSRVTKESEPDRRSSAVMWSLYRSAVVEEGAEPKGKALDLPVHWHPNPYIVLRFGH